MAAYKDGNSVRLISRAGKDHSRRFVELAAAICALPQATLILDGEVAIFDEKLISRAFGHLVKRVGLSNLRFHDLRHDAASTLTMAGVSQRAVMAMLGHRDPRMTVRYQHLSPDHLSEAATALETRPHERSGTTTGAAGPRVSGRARSRFEPIDMALMGR